MNVFLLNSIFIMTYHMEQIRLYGGRSSIEDTAENGIKLGTMAFAGPNIVAPPEKRVPFPVRLWDAVSLDEGSGIGILSWTDDGGAFTVDEDRFEAEVMWRYPGLVQIPSFANFRRQLRVYNFEWRYMDGNQLVFFHRSFVRDNPESVKLITTRRRTVDPRTNADGDSSNTKSLKRTHSSTGLDASPEGSATAQFSGSDTTGMGGENGEDYLSPRQPGVKRRKYTRKRKTPCREPLKSLEQYAFNSNPSGGEGRVSGNLADDILPQTYEMQSALKYDVNPPVVNPTNWTQKYPLESHTSDFLKHYGGEPINTPLYPTRPMLQPYNSQCMHHCCYRCGITWYSPPVQPQPQFYGLPSYYKTNTSYPVQYYHEAPSYTANYIDGTEAAAQVVEGQVGQIPCGIHEPVTEVQGEITVVTADAPSEPSASVVTPMESTYQVAPGSLAGNQSCPRVVSEPVLSQEPGMSFNNGQLVIETCTDLAENNEDDSSEGSCASYQNLSICTSNTNTNASVESQVVSGLESVHESSSASNEVSTFAIL